MKTFFRNLIIILSYLTSIPFWRRLFLSKPVLRVWCLHEVKDNQINQFENKIKYLKNNFNIITPAQFEAGDLAKEKPNVLITFDDGFNSWFKNVLPVFKKHKISAIFFINNHFQDRVGVIVAAGHSLGGHSQNHRRLTELSKEELEQEVWQSQKSDFFAYPFGDKRSFNRQVMAEIKKAGFNYGFTILPGFNTSNTNHLSLHRDSLDADVPDWLFKLWLKGSYDWVKKILFSPPTG